MRDLAGGAGFYRPVASPFRGLRFGPIQVSAEGGSRDYWEALAAYVKNGKHVRADADLCGKFTVELVEDAYYAETPRGSGRLRAKVRIDEPQVLFVQESGSLPGEYRLCEGGERGEWCMAVVALRRRVFIVAGTSTWRRVGRGPAWGGWERGSDVPPGTVIMAASKDLLGIEAEVQDWDWVVRQLATSRELRFIEDTWRGMLPGERQEFRDVIREWARFARVRVVKGGELQAVADGVVIDKGGTLRGANGNGRAFEDVGILRKRDLMSTNDLSCAVVCFRFEQCLVFVDCEREVVTKVLRE